MKNKTNTAADNRADEVIGIAKALAARMGDRCFDDNKALTPAIHNRRMDYLRLSEDMRVGAGASVNAALRAPSSHPDEFLPDVRDGVWVGIYDGRDGANTLSFTYAAVPLIMPYTHFDEFKVLVFGNRKNALEVSFDRGALEATAKTKTPVAKSLTRYMSLCVAVNPNDSSSLLVCKFGDSNAHFGLAEISACKGVS